MAPNSKLIKKSASYLKKNKSYFQGVNVEAVVYVVTMVYVMICVVAIVYVLALCYGYGPCCGSN